MDTADASMARTGYRGVAVESIELSLAYLPLRTPISDAKVLTGRQKPLTQVAFLFAAIRTVDGREGLGFSYSKRAGAGNRR